jgi:16S rRNA processing protein RimM
MVYIGEIVNTHGIKGELRIVSDFKFKEEVFIPGKKLYLGKRKQEEIIKTYRKHKNFDMITFEGICDINEAIIFKGDDVFIKREDLNITGYVDEDIIGLDVYSDKFIGKVDNILKNKQEVLVIKNDEKTYLVPFVKEFVKVDLNNNRINLNVIEGLLDEN